MYYPLKLPLHGIFAEVNTYFRFFGRAFWLPLVQTKELFVEFPVILGKRIRELRKKAGLSQDQAAERAEISGKYLGQVERGEVNVSAIILHRLATVFGVSIVDFYDTSHLTAVSHLKSELMEMINSECDDNIRRLYRVAKAMLR